ncbi:hypothetical protein RSal33209_1074 [Renibacterium salmoninarum ATCC 33209]|uniref:Uncharacterized protein n=1 Tax=Renibacterium salmoninarum (strain ATCC 33209 / DSM 20767 / JCM 11484 / NBRC 15589 / NCIMB 2235) TaxID=288705 RepID=A9WP37_RENSM|nr:hypothetical protein RSal33209_1074 [Renibacterium salmoninarum ATCC 33209]
MSLSLPDWQGSIWQFDPLTLVSLIVDPLKALDFLDLFER